MPSPRRIALGLAALWAAVVVFLGLSERRGVVGLPDSLAEPLQHFVAFAIWAALLSIAFPRRTGWIVGFLAIGGVVGEFLQLATEDRQFDLLDIGVNLAGIAAGGGAVALTRGDRLAVPVFGAAATLLIAAPFVLVADTPLQTSFPDECLPAPGPIGGEPIALLDRRPASASPPTLDPSVAEIKDSILKTGELSIEIWFETPDLTQRGPARMFTISNGIGKDEVDLHVGVLGSSLSVRLRTSCELFNWVQIDDVIEVDTPQHVVVNWSGGIVETWVDGVSADRTSLPWGDFAAWDTGFNIMVGDEIGGRRAFDGTVSSVTMWDRALDEATIRERFSGPST